MTLTDYIPHGLIAALGSIAGYVFRQHVVEDGERFSAIQADLKELVAGQAGLAKNIADNHAEVLKLFISAGQHADAIEALSKARDS